MTTPRAKKLIDVLSLLADAGMVNPQGVHQAARNLQLAQPLYEMFAACAATQDERMRSPLGRTLATVIASTMMLADLSDKAFGLGMVEKVTNDADHMYMLMSAACKGKTECLPELRRMCDVYYSHIDVLCQHMTWRGMEQKVALDKRKRAAMKAGPTGGIARAMSSAE